MANNDITYMLCLGSCRSLASLAPAFLSEQLHSIRAATSYLLLFTVQLVYSLPARYSR